MGDDGTEDSKFQDKPKSWPVIFLCLLGFLISLYVFLVGLQLLGDSFKCLGGKGAGSMFAAINDPIAGLMTGILATVMVQSSSTSTSIVVGLVGARQVTVKHAIPIIMGANIGTSVTNTIVSMGQSGDRLMLERAFAGATVHDMFNYLTVATLLPLEIVIAAIQGTGGPLYWLTWAITDSIIESGNEGKELFESPIKLVTSPVAKLFISNNKYIINALSLGKPEENTPNGTDATRCASSARRLVAEEAVSVGTNWSMLSRRLAGDADCSRYYCVSKNLDKNFKKISKTGYKELIPCDGMITSPDPACKDGRLCFLNAQAYWDDYVQNGRIIKDGFSEGAGDLGGGIIALVFAMVFLVGGLVCLCRCLQFIMMGRAKTIIVYATKLNDYLALLIGLGMTILVQSSSVVTSALTPFCGLGVLPLTKMLPMTLGANIGTTITALIAAAADPTFESLHIALCHLFFNIIGILIWFPVTFMRRIPLGAAKLLGLYASYYRVVPVIYIAVSFVLVPLVALGVSAVWSASVAGGVILMLLVLSATGVFVAWWVKIGCYKVISKEQREARVQELEKVDEAVAGEGDRV